MTIETEAWSLVPGHDDLKRIRKAVGATSMRYGDIVVPYSAEEPAATDQVHATIRRLLRAGETVPNDIAQPIVDARALDDLGQLRSKLMTDVVSRASAAVLAPNSINRALDYLQEQLEQIIAETMLVVPKAGAVSSAEEAIKGDVVDEWRQLSELATQYAEIRRVQQNLYVAALKNSSRKFRSEEFERSALFADALDWHQAWTLPRAERTGREQGDGPLPQAVRDYQEWMLTGLYDSDVLNGMIAPERRLVLAVTQHRPWMPTISQWHAVDDLLRSVTQRPSQAGIAQTETDREDLLSILGTEHTLPDPKRLPFYQQSAKSRVRNIERANLSVTQIRDVQESQRSHQQASEYLASLEGKGGVPVE